MKKFRLNWAKALMMALMLGTIACGKDKDDPNDPNNSVPDPEGTVTVNLSGSTGIEIKNGHTIGHIRWTGPDNFYLSEDYYYYMVSICDLGAMRGLGNITAIPSTGFSTPATSNTSVACEPGHGYVVKFVRGDYRPGDPPGLYVRLYVEEPVVSTTGGIMGAKVKYQYPFEPTTLKLSAPHLYFPTGENSPQTVEITTDAASWSWTWNLYGGSWDWVNVTRNNNTLSVSVTEPNKSIYPREMSIVITAGEKTAFFSVIQAGVASTSAPYAVGDIYKENDVTGIVYKVTGNGSHGMIVSLDETASVWTTSTNNVSYGCIDENNGMNNMDSIKKQASWEGRFPAFKWCNDKNTGTVSGWYLPSINELGELYAAFCGIAAYPGQESDAPVVYRTARDKFNSTLEQNAGTKISEGWYWSSTDFYSGYYDLVRIQNFSDGLQNYDYRTNNKMVRAVRAF
ncbi:MAG: DUF1566 domain-containing protein [Bacteroidales bacterium]|jgi:hypothetical protein|nr:DUF1566 domain-containing protein [Bacteroidales bacterium]